MRKKTVLEMFKLDGKVALITGGSRGLCFSMAMGLAEAGAVVVVCSRNQNECDKAAKEIVKKTGKKSVGCAADVSDETAVTELFEFVMRKFGRLDILINGAGINIRNPIENYPSQDCRKVFDINIYGTWLCCKEAVVIMKKQKSGSIINIGSALGDVGMAERSAYCASKSAVMGLTRVVALELAPFGARCNAICPGPFLTEINKALLKYPEKVTDLIGRTAFKRWGDLKEIRGAAVFLASDASSYMTGSAVYVDGGWTAQ